MLHALGLLGVDGKFLRQTLNRNITRIGGVAVALQHVKQHAVAQCALRDMQRVDLQQVHDGAKHTQAAANHAATVIFEAF